MPRIRAYQEPRTLDGTAPPPSVQVTTENGDYMMFTVAEVIASVEPYLEQEVKRQVSAFRTGLQDEGIELKRELASASRSVRHLELVNTSLTDRVALLKEMLREQIRGDF